MENILKLKGVLDSKKFSKLNNTQIEEFLIKHANKVLPILVKPDYSLEPKEDATHEYSIISEYVLIDNYYNNHGAVKASLVWSRNGGAILLEHDVNRK